jgi:EF hand
MTRILAILTFAACTAALTVSPSLAQPPDDPRNNDRGPSSLVTRMMAFDADKDGKLSKEEVTDSRLQRLFDRADANHDGIVTKEELTALAAKMDREEGPPRGFGRGDDLGPGPPGPRDRGPDDRGPGGPPPGGPRGFPPPGEILPPFLRDRLNVTDDQNRELDELQKEVDAKLAKILTDDQRDQLKQMRNRGPGGPRGSGGPDGPGGRNDFGPGPPPPGRPPREPRPERQE